MIWGPSEETYSKKKNKKKGQTPLSYSVECLLHRISHLSLKDFGEEITSIQNYLLFTFSIFRAFAHLAH